MNSAAPAEQPQSTPIRRPNVFALPREERMRRGLELARRDPLTALRVAVIEHGRIPGSGKKHWGLMWWANWPRRFLPRSGSAHSKVTLELAEFWYDHVQDLPGNWGPRLIAAIALVALDRHQFPRFSMQSWLLFAPKVPIEVSNQPGWLTEKPPDGRRYLEDVRYYRGYLQQAAADIETYVAKLMTLEEGDSSHMPTANSLTAGLAKVAILAAENQLAHARSLRAMAAFLAIHGRAGQSAKSAARGIFVRVLDFALGNAPEPLKKRFITLILDDLAFGTKDTYRGVHSILRASHERSSN